MTTQQKLVAGFALDCFSKAQGWAGRLVREGFNIKIEKKPYTGFCHQQSGSKREVFSQECYVVTAELNRS